MIELHVLNALSQSPDSHESICGRDRKSMCRCGCMCYRLPALNHTKTSSHSHVCMPSQTQTNQSLACSVGYFAVKNTLRHRNLPESQSSKVQSAQIPLLQCSRCPSRRIPIFPVFANAKSYTWHDAVTQEHLRNSTRCSCSTGLIPPATAP